MDKVAEAMSLAEWCKVKGITITEFCDAYLAHGIDWRRFYREVSKGMSLAEWCEANRISRGTYYNMVKAGKGPRIMRAGKRIIITPEANDEWRKAREAESVQSAA